MPDERWEKIKSLYDEAMQIDSTHRPQFLADACGGDEGLRREIESLLDANEKNDQFLDDVVGYAAADLLANRPASSLPQRIGPYEIKSTLGQGGMGIVYRGRDTILKRDIALKVLPAQFAQDAERLSRFQREAQALAALNHPNVAQIYGVEGTGASRCIVMEFVEGETLADRVKRGPLTIDEALSFAKSICEALEAAHEKGIVHRDLKPANVKVTPEGKVKVLDFGLAKAFAEEAGTTGPQNAPTEGNSPTIQGAILGTAAYMSPEQARGKTVDKRTDIWSFGCVLYELLTGKRVFYGDDTTEILAAVLKGEPDWSALPGGTPPNIRVLLRRCLQKDIARRLRDATDARIEVEDALTASGPALPIASKVIKPPLRSMSSMATAVCLSVVVGIAVWTLKPAPVPDPQPVSRFTIAVPSIAPFIGGTDPNLVVSPDGKYVVYVAARTGTPRQLYVRALDAVDATPLAGTEDSFAPFFSPDGRWIAFFSGQRLKKVSVNGGTVLTLCNTADAQGGTWGADDTIVFSPTSGSSGLFTVSAAGGEPRPFTTLQQHDVSHRWPQFLPDGRTVLFAIGPGTSADDAEIAVQQLGSNERKVIVLGGTSPRYARSGHLLYYRAGTIMAAPFDLARLEVTAPPVPVVEAVMGDPRSGAVQFSLSNSGSMAYMSGGTPSADLRLVWVDRRGIAQPLAAPLRPYRAPRLSPDGRQVAVGIGADLWIYDVPRDTLSRFTFDGINATNAAVWTPDGKRVVFPSSKHGEPENLFWKLVDGSGPEERLTSGQDQLRIGSFSPDGRTIMYTLTDPKTKNDLWVMPLDGDRKPRVFLQTPFIESSGLISPDGHWVAYTSDESGQVQVYVRPFAGTGGKYQISIDGGSEAAWSPKGNELFYRTGGQHEKMMAVDVQTQGAFIAGKPHLLFEQTYYSAGGTGAQYSVSPDGQRFLMLKPPDQQQTSLNQVNVVLNWPEELKVKIPKGK